MDPDQLEAVLLAVNAQNQTAMTTFATSLADVFKQDRAEDKLDRDQAAAQHTEAMKKLQKQIDQQSGALVDVISRLDKTDGPKGDVQNPKDFTKPSKFPHCAATDAGAQGAFLVAFTQMVQHMSRTAKYMATTNFNNWKKYSGRAAVELKIFDKHGGSTAAASYERLDDVLKEFIKTVENAYANAFYIAPDDVFADTPDDAYGNKAVLGPLREKNAGGERIPMCDQLWRRKADEELYDIITATFQHPDWQLRFQQHIGACYGPWRYLHAHAC